MGLFDFLFLIAILGVGCVSGYVCAVKFGLMGGIFGAAIGSALTWLAIYILLLLLPNGREEK